MRFIKYLSIFLLGSVLTGCQLEDVADPVFGDDEIPYIYMEWAGTNVYNVGDVIHFSPQVSPLEGTQCRWLIDGDVISTERELTYTITQTQPFTLRFEVERNGIVNYRSSEVTIIVPFEPKQAAKNVIGVLTEDGVAAQIQWDYITHLQVTPFKVDKADGSITMPSSAFLNNLKTMISLAHNKGVYVIADITAPINLFLGTGFYNESSFNTVAADPALRKVLIDNILSLVTEYDFDGVNIYINNLNNDWGGIKDKDKVLEFMDELGASLPKDEDCERGSFFYTASVPMAWNSYEFYFMAGCKYIDWFNFMMFGATDLSPVHHSADWNINEKVGGFYDQGISLDQVVVTIPCTGVKYDIPAGVSPTWGNIDSFLSYYKYSEIVAGMDKTNLFYVGLTGDNSVESKISIAMNNWGASGMMVWAMDFDTADPATSITQNVYKRINP